MGSEPEATAGHVPVLVSEVLEGLALAPGGIYVDGTLGMGGHAEAVLAHHPPVQFLVALDQDADAVEKARARLVRFGSRVRFVCSNFVRLPEVLAAEEIVRVDGIVLDLGVSSFQLEVSGRGFSFVRDEPLDMRMDRSGAVTAADMVNELPGEHLAELIRTYGEETWARRIAQALVRRRHERPILTSADLARVVFEAIPRRRHPRRIHPATRTFQALRIAVNRELDNLKEALEHMPSWLRPGGRLCIISFHSLEDRLVKHAFRKDVRLMPLTKRPIMAADKEVALNPRARSAKLRVAERVGG